MRGALIQLLYCQENPFGERRHLSSFVRAVVSLPFAKTHLTREPVCFVWLRGLSSFSHSSTTESSETGRLPPESAALSSCHGPSCAYTSDPPAWPVGLITALALLPFHSTFLEWKFRKSSGTRRRETSTRTSIGAAGLHRNAVCTPHVGTSMRTRRNAYR